MSLHSLLRQKVSAGSEVQLEVLAGAAQQRPLCGPLVRGWIVFKCTWNDLWDLMGEHVTGIHKNSLLDPKYQLHKDRAGALGFVLVLLASSPVISAEDAIHPPEIPHIEITANS